MFYYFDGGRKYLSYLGCFWLYENGAIRYTGGTDIPQVKELLGL